MKKWKTITIVTGLLVAVVAFGAVRLSASTIPLGVLIRMEAGLPADAVLAPNKEQALLKNYQVRQAALRVPPGAKQSNVKAEDPGPAPVSGPTGIMSHDEGNDGMVPASTFTFGNSWIGNVNGVRTVVYAGSEGKELGNPNQGIIWVNTDSGILSYKTSSLDGGLTITAVNGNVLTLKAEAGSTYTFDLVTKTMKRQ